ncbi:MAG TPA: hypothetical protein VD846_06945 [Allosphingosinicella sp.]|nr:hypothetical protein [Allosphingosinicella sp.]
MDDRESAGYLLGETARLLRVNAGLALAAVAALTLIGVVSDLYPAFAGPAGFASLIALLVFQYEISSRLLIHYDLVDGGGRRRLWALLGLHIVSGLGILLGLILLVLPAAYLFVRWSAAVPALIAEETGVTESLRVSGEAVEGRFWHVFAAILVVWTPYAAGLLAWALAPEDGSLIESLIVRLPVNLSLIAAWHLAVATYAGRQNHHRLAEVFA